MGLDAAGAGRADAGGARGAGGAAAGAGGRTAQEYARTRDWPGYFEAVKGKPARETLLAALERFEREGRVDAAGWAGAGGAGAGGGREGGGVEDGRVGSVMGWRAIDLGCGEGRDTAELVARGWRVLALDGHPEGIARTVERLGPRERERVEARVARFEDLVEGGWEGAGEDRWEMGVWDLVNASFALPFCAPERFGAVWRWVVGALKPGGRFCGQLFGDRDEWAAIADRTHHRRGELDGLFAGFMLEELREEEKDSPEVSGRVKHWHVFHIVARKM